MQICRQQNSCKYLVFYLNNELKMTNCKPDKVQVQYFLEVLDGEVIDGSEWRMPSGVVHQTVDTPVLCNCHVNHILDILLLRNIALHIKTFPWT